MKITGQTRSFVQPILSWELQTHYTAKVTMINCRLRNQQPMASSSGTIKQFKLQGHKSSVLCLAHSSDIDRNANTVGCLLSGSEDKTARIWDLRGGTCRASICVVAPGEVVSAAFAPKQSSSDQTGSGAFARNFSM